MKKLLIGFVILTSMSCIPLKNAPRIADYDIVVAKKFKKDLPKSYAFVFQDNKNADEFYQFLYFKLGRIDYDLDADLPFKVGNKTYYLTFHERPRQSVTLNLLPIFVDATLQSQGLDPALGELYESGDESWYILITVVDSEYRDCLKPSYANQQEVVLALNELKDEYNNTHHYVEAYLKQE